MRLLSIAAALLLAGCGPPPAPVASTRADPTQQLWYGEAVTQLAALDRQAESLYQSGQSDEAAALVTKGESLTTQILDVPRPTLAAMETVSDLDRRPLRRSVASTWQTPPSPSAIVTWGSDRRRTRGNTRPLPPPGVS